MNKTTPPLRSTLGKIRALGPAHAGTDHWWLQRLTALALIPLAVYPLAAFLILSIYGTYDDTIRWLRSPYGAGAVILFLGVAFHHAVSGLQVIVEDYVHSETPKIASLVVIKFAAVVLALLGVLSTLKIMLGV